MKLILFSSIKESNRSFKEAGFKVRKESLPVIYNKEEIYPMFICTMLFYINLFKNVNKITDIVIFSDRLSFISFSLSLYRDLFEDINFFTIKLDNIRLEGNLTQLYLIQTYLRSNKDDYLIIDCNQINKTDLNDFKNFYDNFINETPNSFIFSSQQEANYKKRFYHSLSSNNKVKDINNQNFINSQLIANAYFINKSNDLYDILFNILLKKEKECGEYNTYSLLTELNDDILYYILQYHKSFFIPLDYQQHLEENKLAYSQQYKKLYDI